MANLRTILLVGIVITGLLYLFSVMNKSTDGFADLGEKVNVFTLYYMNGCPHCMTLLPAFKDFVAAGQVVGNGSKTKIRMLEQADPSAGPEIEARNIKGFPTFILATTDGKYLEYQGDRTVPAMTDFIKKNAV
jgi:thiol-disulfide isomerase/thioredoxin